MVQTRLDYSRKAADLVRRDFIAVGVPQNKVATALGLSTSTFGDFLNAKSTIRGNQKRTLEKLMACEAWKEDTRQALEILLHYDDLALRNMLLIKPAANIRHAAE